MEQILEYSFARVLVRVAGALLFTWGAVGLSTNMLWIVGSFVFPETGFGNNYIYLLLSAFPSLGMVGVGLYLARDGHLLARIVTSGMHGRCRKCGYDIRAVTAGACPECGTPLPRAPDPHGTASISAIRHDPSNTPADGR